MSKIIARDIIESIPSRFRPEKANGYKGVFHLNIKGDDGGQYTVSVDGDTCELSEGLIGDADCVIRASDRVYLQIETGERNPQVALMTGMVKVSDVSQMITFSKIFYRFRPEYNGPDAKKNS